jgi:hypothetical protein
MMSRGVRRCHETERSRALHRSTTQADVTTVPYVHLARGARPAGGLCRALLVMDQLLTLGEGAGTPGRQVDNFCGHRPTYDDM